MIADVIIRIHREGIDIWNVLGIVGALMLGISIGLSWGKWSAKQQEERKP